MMRIRFDKIQSIRESGREIGRSLGYVDREPIVVLHKRGQRLAPTNRIDWPQTLSTLDSGPVFELEQSAWTWTQGPYSDFNCHSMAIGSQVGLQPSDWLEGCQSKTTLRKNPASILLDRFFRQLDPRPPSRSIQDDDVCVCYDSFNDHYVHSALIKRIGDRPFAISKFGEGPILITTLEFIHRFFAGRFDQLQWYRRRHDR
ncbi:MAG: hypothetical protein AAF802_29575 [Planctomycetota bacterium]